MPRDESLPQPSGGWIARALRTSLGDLLVGRVTGYSATQRLVEQIRSAPISAPLRDVVWCVVRRSKLWSREKRDVAAELIAHFEDGLDAGATDDRLLADFGDPAQAARLIRKAKLRNRPLPYRLVRRAAQGFVLLLAFVIALWGLLLVRYQFAYPSIKVDYVALLDASAKAVPTDQRAWPVYRAAILGMDPKEFRDFRERYDRDIDKGDSSSKDGMDQQGSDVWQWIIAHQPLLDQVRTAASRPVFGFIHSDPENAAYAARHGYTMQQLSKPEEGIVALLLPYYDEVRSFARMLSVDARRALREGRGDAFLDNVRAQIGIADQVWTDRKFLIGQLVSFAILHEAIDVVRESLVDKPDLLSRDDLIGLAHRLSAFAGGGRVAIDFRSEFLMHNDILQRVYTDDGNGNGYLAGPGSLPLQLIDSLSGSDPASRMIDVSVSQLGHSAMAVVVASRREMKERFDDFLREAQSEACRPPWERAADKLDNELKQLANSPLSKIRYHLLILLAPGVTSTTAAADRITTLRDATLAAIALTLYHRDTGAWPGSLSDLLPKYLPFLPLDPFDGQPLRYKLSSGQPLLYSIGANKTDDGGTPPADEKNDFSAKTGDWVLWPVNK